MIELPWLLYVLLGVNAAGSLTDAVLRVLRYRQGRGQADADIDYRRSQTKVNRAVAKAMRRAVDTESGEEMIERVARLRDQSA